MRPNGGRHFDANRFAAKEKVKQLERRKIPVRRAFLDINGNPQALVPSANENGSENLLNIPEEQK